MPRTTRKRKEFSRSQRVFFREWRNYRNLTLEQAAERIGMTHANLSRIELGRQRYDETTLSRMAEAYRCEPVDLLVRDPSDPEGLWSIWDQLRPAQKPQAAAILKALRDTAA